MKSRGATERKPTDWKRKAASYKRLAQRFVHQAFERDKVSLRRLTDRQVAYVAKNKWRSATGLDGEENALLFAKDCAMITSEISEALEAVRKHKGMDAVREELADVLLRLVGVAANLGIDSDALVTAGHAKMDKNLTRPFQHGGRAV